MPEKRDLRPEPGGWGPKVLVALSAGLFAVTSFAMRTPRDVGLTTLDTAVDPAPVDAPSLSAAGSAAPLEATAGADADGRALLAGGAALESADGGAAMPAAPAAPHVFRVIDLKSDPEIEIEEVTVGKSSFVGRLARVRVPLGDVFRVQRAFEKVVKFDRTADNDRIVIAKRRKDNHVVALEYIASPRDVWQAKEEGKTLVGHRLTIVPEREKIARAIAIRSDLHAAGAEAGLGEDVLAAIDEALAGRLALGHVPAGARIKVIATREMGADKSEADSRVVIDALECMTGKNSFRVYFFDPRRADDAAPALSLSQLRKSDGLRGYYDDGGRRSERGDFRAPLPFRRVSSHFNPRRMHPVLHTVMPHNGIDFAAPTGTPVYATGDGTLRSLGDSGACGNMVQVDHGKGLVTAYCHLSRFAPGLFVGAPVHARTLLGFVGQTGRATGPHLHFAVKRNNRFVDPLSLRMDRVHTLGGSLKHAFDVRRKELDPELDRVDGTRVDLPGAAGVPDDDNLDDLNP